MRSAGSPTHVAWHLLEVSLGLLIGPVLLSALAVAPYWVLDPVALEDGQFLTLAFVTVPFGVLLGGLAGAVAVRTGEGRRRQGGDLAIRGGLTTIVCALALWVPWFEFGPLEWFATLFLGACLSLAGVRIRSAALRTRFWAEKRLHDPGSP